MSQGDILYFNGTHLTRLAVGTTGQFLQTQGANANPQWATNVGFLPANNLSEVANAANARANIGVAASAQTDFICGFIPTPANQAYALVINLPFGCVITKTTTICTGGTFTATWLSGGVNLGATNAVSTSQSAPFQTTNNTVAAGKDITLTISANAACVNMSFTIQFTYALN